MMKKYALVTKLVCFIAIIAMSFKVSPLAAQTRVQIETNMGTMHFRLYDDTPRHKAEFIKLANEGYYNGTLFYRVISDFLIQGGSRSSRNAPAGKRIGYGSPEHTVNDEIRSNHFHKKGALCAPRQADEINPFKQSDISQFYVIKGRVLSEGFLDTLEMAVNNPIKRRIQAKVYTDEKKEEIKRLRTEIENEKNKEVRQRKIAEFKQLTVSIKEDIEAEMNLDPHTLYFSPEQRNAYTTVGGYPELDGKYTVFGELEQGSNVVDKISKLKTDKNERPYTDVKIISIKIIN